MDNGILRVMVDEPRAGAVNMAIDEAILLAVQDRAAPVTLRFYRWAEPTVSLGYFQKYDAFTAQEDPIRSLAIVRRQTGGGAILHDEELTYSLTVPVDEQANRHGIETLYRLVHDAVCEALAGMEVAVSYRGGSDRGNSQRGPFFCFARGHSLDLVCDGEKLLGSAQRRLKGAVLQHGSLILARRFEQQPAAELNHFLQEPFDRERFISIVAEITGRQLSLTPGRGTLSDRETRSLAELTTKYESVEWTRQR